MRRLLSVIFLAGLGLAGLANAGEDALPPHAREQLETIDTVNAGLLLELQLARHEIEAGRDEDGWTDAQKASAVGWIDALLPPPSSPLAPPASFDHWKKIWNLTRFLERPVTLDGVSGTAIQLLRFRLTRLCNLYNRSLDSYAWEALREAEDAWARAKKPADLAPALRWLTPLKDRAFYWPKSIPGYSVTPFPFAVSFSYSSGYSGGPISNAFEAWLLLAGPEPFLLPDPEKNPADYVEARERLYRLEKFSLRFLILQKVDTYISSCDRRFAYAARKAQDIAESLILQGAPTPEIIAAEDHLAKFALTLPQSPKPVGGSPQANPGIPAPPLILTDYRALLTIEPPAELQPTPGPSPSYFQQRRTFNPPLSAEVLEVHRLYRDLLAAPATMPEVDRKTLRGKILRHAAELGEPMEIRLKEILENPESTIPDTVDLLSSSGSKKPRERLVEQLIAVARQTADVNTWTTPEQRAHRLKVNEAARELLKYWDTTNPNERAKQVPPGSLEECWRLLMDLAGTEPLFVSRERVVRELLAPVGSSADPSTNIARLFREQLGHSTAQGERSRARQLIELDQLTGYLEPKENQSWTVQLDLMEKARAFEAQQNSDGARTHYRQILGLTTDATIAEAAAKGLRQNAVK